MLRIFALTMCLLLSLSAFADEPAAKVAKADDSQASRTEQKKLNQQFAAQQDRKKASQKQAKKWAKAQRKATKKAAKTGKKSSSKVKIRRA